MENNKIYYDYELSKFLFDNGFFNLGSVLKILKNCNIGYCYINFMRHSFIGSEIADSIHSIPGAFFSLEHPFNTLVLLVSTDPDRPITADYLRRLINNRAFI